ncbi:MAG: HNH endonuclease, partial [Actinobacteria bacterium]|nr:HNH endonuclease [Actinomycetota bacterium]
AVCEELEQLLTAVRRLRRRVRTGRSHAEVAEGLRSLRHACNLLELEFSVESAAFAATYQCDEYGAYSPIYWIRHECQMSGRTASDALCVGEQLATLPGSVEAMEERQIGFGHLALLASTARSVAESPGASPFDETRLLSQARKHTVSRFRNDCSHARHAADVEGFLREHLDTVEARSLKLSTNERGSLFIKGWLDSVGGAAVLTALEALARPQGADDHRDRERRLADALVELAGHGLDEGVVPQRAGQRPHLQVTTTVETLRGLAGAPAGELEYASPIPAATVERLACDATISRVLLDSDSKVIDVGRAQRVVPGSTRRALNVRDQGCRWPGCERSASWTAAHHIHHWARGGPTDMINLVSVCGRHHWLVHECGWQLVRGPDEEFVTIPPVQRYQSWARAPDSS